MKKKTFCSWRLVKDFKKAAKHKILKLKFQTEGNQKFATFLCLINKMQKLFMCETSYLNKNKWSTRSNGFLTFLISSIHFFITARKDWKTTLFWVLSHFLWFLNNFPVIFDSGEKKFLFEKTFVGLVWEKEGAYNSCCQPRFLPVVVCALLSRTTKPSERYSMDCIRDLLQRTDCASHEPCCRLKTPSWWDISSRSSDSVHNLQQTPERYVVTLFVWLSEDESSIHFKFFSQQPSKALSRKMLQIFGFLLFETLISGFCVLLLF